MSYQINHQAFLQRVRNPYGSPVSRSQIAEMLRTIANQLDQPEDCISPNENDKMDPTLDFTLYGNGVDGNGIIRLEVKKQK